MASNSPSAGTYILMGVRFRRRNDDGSFTLFKQGDEVELSAAEAARLVGTPHSSFKAKPKSTPVSSDESDDETVTPTTSLTGLPVSNKGK